MEFLYSAPMTTILVGSEQERFVVHKALLCNKSKYFTKALTGSFEESKTGIVKLDDVSPVLFRIFVTWLYDNVIRYTAPDDSHNLEEDLGSIKSCDTCSQNAPDRDGDVPSTWPYCALIELYLFGDRFDAQQFRVETIDALSYALDKQDNGMSFEEHYYICKNTSARSPLRQFAIHRMAYTTIFKTEELEIWSELPSEYLAQVMIEMGMRMPGELCGGCYKRGLEENEATDLQDLGMSSETDEAPYDNDMCFYHEHANEEERERCRDLRNTGDTD
ncbi:hypothetical protein D6C86_04409 [Aureobasidium pullulans]|nr:hypothetical protein D6C86_04409 [Aureobasidium pullulans]